MPLVRAHEARFHAGSDASGMSSTAPLPSCIGAANGGAAAVAAAAAAASSSAPAERTGSTGRPLIARLLQPLCLTASGELLAGLSGRESCSGPRVAWRSGDDASGDASSMHLSDTPDHSTSLPHKVSPHCSGAEHCTAGTCVCAVLSCDD